MRKNIPKFAFLGLLLFAVSGIRVEAQETVRAQGFLKMEVWDELEGVTVADLYDDPRFPNEPSRTFFTTALDSQVVLDGGFDSAGNDNYGGKISGFITVPENGDYWLFLRSDDGGELYFNPEGEDSDPNKLVFVAEETGCCGPFEAIGTDLTSFEPYSLKKGDYYYIELIWKEGGGGDYAQVAFLEDGDVDFDDEAGQAAALLPISSEFIAVDAPAADITIVSQSHSGEVTAAENSILTFSVEAESEGTPLLIQWQKNGETISGAVGGSYSLPPLTADDNGATFQAIASVPGASATIEEIKLIVTDDNAAPGLISAEGSFFFGSVTLKFNEPLEQTSSETAGNYTITNPTDGSSIDVTGAVRSGEVDNIITLATGDQAKDTGYLVEVTGVKDRSGNAVNAGTSIGFQSFVLTPGKAQFEFYADVAGNTTQVLLDDPRYQNGEPDTVDFVDLYEGPTNIGDDYGAVLRAIYSPSEDGDYAFFVAADNQGLLYLSTDENPANKKLIADEPDWNPVRAWTNTARRPGCDEDDPNSDFSECPHRSDQFVDTEWPDGNTISLKADQGYYMELAMSEGGGGDNMAVLATLASNVANVENDQPPIGGENISWFVPSSVTPPEGNPFGGDGGGPAPPVVPPVVLPPIPGGGDPGEIQGIARAVDGTVSITFTGTLQSADSIVGPFAPVAGASSPFQVDGSAGARFYIAR